MRDHEVERIGRRLSAEGLVAGNFGNISVRKENGFLIKRSGAYLDDPGPLVFVPFEGEQPPEASREARVHREIYLQTEATAVVHAHPPHTVAASLLFEEIIPLDVEGKMMCPRIRVIFGGIGSEELATNAAGALASSPVVIARGHGTFAAGRTLEEAYLVTAAAEHSCRILHLLGRFQLPFY
jgi:L-fuculose-phosphate aldolase